MDRNHLISIEKNTRPPKKYLFCLNRLGAKKSSILVIILALSILVLYQILHNRYQTFDEVLIYKIGSTPSSSLVKANRILVEPNSLHTNGHLRYKHTKRRLPDCIVIGARKAGTRALLTYLDLHPHVRTAKNEVHFFDDDNNFGEGYEWYRKKMPYTFEGHITIEKTPAYFVCDYVPERIYRMNSTIKLLLVVRDPVERTVSDYLQIKDNKIKRRKAYETFENLAINNITGEVNRDYTAIKRSIYYRHMLPWLQWFPLEQIYLVSAEELVKNPYTTMKSIESYLGVEHRITDDMFIYNSTRHFFCVRNGTENKCLAKSKGRVHPTLNPLIKQKLYAFFQKWNQKFYNLVHHDFGWP